MERLRPSSWVTASFAGLSGGVYNGQIVISGPNNTLTVPVQLTINTSNFFVFSQPSVTFSVQAGSAAPPAQTVTVYGPSTGLAYFGVDKLGRKLVERHLGQGAADVAANPAGLAGRYLYRHGHSDLTVLYRPGLVSGDAGDLESAAAANRNALQRHVRGSASSPIGSDEQRCADSSSHFRGRSAELHDERVQRDIHDACIHSVSAQDGPRA